MTSAKFSLFSAFLAWSAISIQLISILTAVSQEQLFLVSNIFYLFAMLKIELLWCKFYSDLMQMKLEVRSFGASMAILFLNHRQIAQMVSCSLNYYSYSFEPTAQTQTIEVTFEPKDYVKFSKF